MNLDRKLRGLPFQALSNKTMLGALVDYILHFHGKKFEPMNANWALIPSVLKSARIEAAQESLKWIDQFVEGLDE